jgi:hypothetical protein
MNMGAFKCLGRTLRNTSLAVLALAIVGVGAAVVESLPTSTSHDAAVDSRADGWGVESLAEVHEGVSGFSLIGVANACGLGASSCFKCHNGSRADAPNEDPATAPWHAEHRTVNNSCSGCHNGNPRIIRKEMSHKNLISDPRLDTEKSCVSCHSADADQKVTRYLSVVGGGK